MQLDDFVQQQKKAGHTKEAIRQFLLSQGYKPEDANSALKRAFPTHVPLFVLTGVLFVILLAIIVFFLWPEAEPVFDVRSEVKKAEVAAGSQLEFKTIIINPENVKTDVTLLHELVLGNTLLGQKRGTVSVTKTQEFAQTFPVPSAVKPGKYVLRTTAFFDDISAETEANITVLAAIKKEFKPVTTPAPVLEEIGVEIPVEERKVPLLPVARKPEAKPEEKPKAAPEYTPGINVRITEIAKTRNPAECATLPTAKDRDSCHAAVAAVVMDATICLKIEQPLLHDSCLFNAGNKDCTLYKNEMNRQLCEVT